MRKINDKKFLRVIDANFNRAKEGLRVCEDVCRFVLDNRMATKTFKDLRHKLTESIKAFGIKEIIANRNIEGDVGRSSISFELKRKSVEDIFYANSQRTKESIRVLEEFSKLFNKKSTKKLKEIRYKVYAVEKKIVGKF